MTPACNLSRIALNVSDPEAATRFYRDALGFAVVQELTADPALARVLNVRTVHATRLRRGAQILELSACDPPGAPIPTDSRSNDAWFQHCALATTNMAGDYEKLRQVAITPISTHGPQTLPGGIAAFKFRDPDGHPLELITFTVPNPVTLDGIDHSAISVTSLDRSIAFYTARLGLAPRQRQLNQGPAQDALDNLDAVAVDVLALKSPVPGPHVELLHYRHPSGRTATAHPNDLLATRLVFTEADLPNPAHTPDQHSGAPVELLHDPDGHAILRDNRR